MMKGALTIKSPDQSQASIQNSKRGKMQPVCVTKPMSLKDARDGTATITTAYDSQNIMSMNTTQGHTMDGTNRGVVTMKNRTLR